MRRLIPPRTKVKSTLGKNYTYTDLGIDAICVILAGTAVSANIGWFKWVLAVIFLLAGLALVLPYAHGHKGYEWLGIMTKYLFSKKTYTEKEIGDLLAYKNEDGIVDLYGTFAAVIEISPIELLLYKDTKQNQILSQFAEMLRYVKTGSIVKIEKPIDYSAYILRYQDEMKKIKQEQEKFIEEERALAIKQHKAFDAAKVDVTAFTARLAILENSIIFLDYMNIGKKIKAEVYYFVIYEKKKEQLATTVKDAVTRLTSIGLFPRTLNSKEITTMLSYFIYGDEVADFKLPSIQATASYIMLGADKKTVAMVGQWPVFAEGEAWAAPLFQIPHTNVVINYGSTDKTAVIKSINKSIKEIRYRYLSEKDASGQQNLQIQAEALMLLLQQFQLGNESVHNTSMYIMYGDSEAEKVRQAYQSAGYILNNLSFRQIEGLVSMLPVVGKDFLPVFNRHLQSSTLSAAFPFINNVFMDTKGDYLGDFRYPIFFDIWQRDKKRVNSNLCILGQAGGGKTFLQKKLLMQQAVAGTKIFVLDCENEYSYMVKKFGGQTIEMSGTNTINPFHVFPSFSPEDEELFSSPATMKNSGDLSAQCNFLSEWIGTILPMDLDCKSRLNNVIAEMYKNKKITDYSDFSKFADSDFPTFDDLLDLIRAKLKTKNVSAYEFATLQKLENYITMFTGTGIFARLWNGKTRLNIEKEFTVFDFQKLFANGNTEVCNAQMMLLMRMLMREVIKVKDRNELTGRKDHVIVLVDEAHRYLSEKFPTATDTLEQFARRIRKYAGSLIVASQNINDFANKAAPIRNNCQFSMLFGLKADDINKVQELYANYGGGLIKEELDFLTAAQLGQMLFLVEPEKRTAVQVALLNGELQYIEAA